MSDSLLLELSESQGRIGLRMTVQRLGCDVNVSLFGGDAHVGAVALAVPQGQGPCQKNQESQENQENLAHSAAAEASPIPARSPDVSVLTVPGHREDALARQVAQTLSGAWLCRVCVVCGIHFDHITKDEIALVLALADRLTHKALQDAAATVAPL